MSKIILASCDDGIYRSTDLGASWSSVNASKAFTDVAVTGNGICYGYANDGDIQKSSDGGQSWASVGNCGLEGAEFYPSSIVAISESVLLAAGKNQSDLYGNVRKSTNGGVTWASTTFPFTVLTENADIINLGGGNFAALFCKTGDTASDFYLSSNSGDTWAQAYFVESGGTRIYYKLENLGSGVVLAFGNNGTGGDATPAVLRSTDYGDNYSLVYWPNPDYSVNFECSGAALSSSEILFLTAYGWFNPNRSTTRSVNSGVNWSAVVSGTFIPMCAAHVQGDIVIAGNYQYDDGVRSTDKGSNWSAMTIGARAVNFTVFDYSAEHYQDLILYMLQQIR